MNTELTTQKYDIIIVGGGMVGATLACALGNSNYSVAIIERNIPSAFDPQQPHDLRVSALSIASQKILQTIGAWDNIVNKRTCPFARMRVWETVGDTEFNCRDSGLSELGFIVENRVIQLSLLEHIPHFSNLHLISDVNIDFIDYNHDCSTIQLDNQYQLQCKLLIAADGGQSRTRHAMGIGVNSWDYDQHALVINVETALPQQDITWQRFVKQGPQAFLPLSGHHASLVWYNAPDNIKKLKSLSDKALIEAIEQTFPQCLGAIEKIEGKASFPLKRQHAQQYVKQGAAVIGDAAHMINPLAGQGVNIGLLDAAALAEILWDAQQNKQNFADLSLLKNYEAMRKQENLKMMTVMDLFYRVFSNDILPIKILRNLGLGMAEHIKPAKIRVMKEAMGLEGKRPKLAKGHPLP